MEAHTVAIAVVAEGVQQRRGERRDVADVDRVHVIERVALRREEKGHAMVVDRHRVTCPSNSPGASLRNGLTPRSRVRARPPASETRKAVKTKLRSVKATSAMGE
jgi:hypothetical protein